MELKKLSPINKKQISDKGVQALADRPNHNAQYGVGGLSALQVKAWFDKLAMLLAEKINELQGVLSGEDAAAYIRVAIEGSDVETLDDLIRAITSGKLASELLRVLPSGAYDASDEDAYVTLQMLINGMAKTLSDHSESLTDHSEALTDHSEALTYHSETLADHGSRIDTLEEKAQEQESFNETTGNMLDNHDERLIIDETRIENNMLDIESLWNSKLNEFKESTVVPVVYAVEHGVQTMIKVWHRPMNGAIVRRQEDGQIEVYGVPGNLHAVNKGYVDTADLLLGAKLTVSVDPDTYVMTVKLVNTKGTVLSEQSVNLPLESMLADVAQDGETLVFTLQNGQSIRMDMSAMLSGSLMTTEQFNEHIRIYEAKVDGIQETVDALSSAFETLDERLPTVTEADEGKFAVVVNGAWAAVKMTNVSEVAM